MCVCCENLGCEGDGNAGVASGGGVVRGVGRVCYMIFARGGVGSVG